jgi:hypothetical protein
MFSDLFNYNDREVFFDVNADHVVSTTFDILSDDKKMLLRTDRKDNSSSYLSIVNSKYRVVLNEEILRPLQEQMVEYFDQSVLEEIKIKDTVTKNGAICYSEYIFPRLTNTIETNTGHKTEIGLRYIMKNTFDGSGSIVLYGGAIDFFCTNGLIRGEYDVTRRRHTKNFSVAGFKSAFENSMERFTELVSMYQEYADIKIKSVKAVEDVFNALARTDPNAEKKREGGLSDKLFSQYAAESTVRGHNLFSVASALTHYASHNDERFPLTKAGDNGTLFKRQERVTKWLDSKAWYDFVNDNRRIMVTV